MPRTLTLAIPPREGCSLVLMSAGRRAQALARRRRLGSAARRALSENGRDRRRRRPAARHHSPRFQDRPPRQVLLASLFFCFLSTFADSHSLRLARSTLSVLSSDARIVSSASRSCSPRAFPRSPAPRRPSRKGPQTEALEGPRVSPRVMLDADPAPDLEGSRPHGGLATSEPSTAPPGLALRVASRQGPAM